MGKIMVCVHSRPPDQEEQVYEVFYGQIRASCFYALVVTGHFSYCNAGETTQQSVNNPEASWKAVTTS